MKDIRKDERNQFARMLAEIRAVGLTKKQLKALRESTDMTDDQIARVLYAAELVYETAKAEL